MNKRVVVLAAQTARSQAYLQALERAGVDVSAVIFMGLPDIRISRTVHSPTLSARSPSVHLPNPDEPREVTCARAGWKTHHCSARDVNDPEVIEALSLFLPGLVVYSGYGGQLVDKRTLDLDGSFLHMHAGWLPAYRGSTTVYYSLLQENRCAVSAILLDAGIDTGPIVKRAYYPPPPAGLDIDHLYDSAIRADLMIQVVAAYLECGMTTEGVGTEDMAQTYYVIHPILKHVALLKLGYDTSAMAHSTDP